MALTEAEKRRALDQAERDKKLRQNPAIIILACAMMIMMCLCVAYAWNTGGDMTKGAIMGAGIASLMQH